MCSKRSRLRQYRDQATNVVGIALGNDVDILRGYRRTVNDRGGPSDHDELHACAHQRLEQRVQISNVLQGTTIQASTRAPSGAEGTSSGGNPAHITVCKSVGR